MSQTVIEIKNQRDIISARQAGREMAREFSFKLADQTRLATAISELTRNVIQYAGEGTCTIKGQMDEKQVKISVEVEDNGPGIPDLEKAMTYGFTTGNGLGAGLPGSRSLMHEFQITTRPGFTKISIALIRRKL
ncbi:MAG: anti-sigma regulatory factor [Syntrophobacteraceae bacterium]